ncbi:hypothetical protein B296_00004312 [Ensete ventricosum]|uniref:Uncharacterized protein n=1 Tax=Ensete ventricosum TaxID=4639 RepID=A0A427AW19_ENSVE|nr:hypothetical protein B296_00004312 [Ensete ventricosum]
MLNPDILISRRVLRLLQDLAVNLIVARSSETNSFKEIGSRGDLRAKGSKESKQFGIEKPARFFTFLALSKFTSPSVSLEFGLTFTTLIRQYYRTIWSTTFRLDKVLKSSLLTISFWAKSGCSFSAVMLFLVVPVVVNPLDSLWWEHGGEPAKLSIGLMELNLVCFN